MRFESQAQGDPLRLTVSRAPVVVPFPLPMLVDHAFGELVDSLPKAVTIGRRSQFLDALVQVCRGSQRQTRMTVLMFSQRRDEAGPGGLEFGGCFGRRRPAWQCVGDGCRRGERTTAASIPDGRQLEPPLDSPFRQAGPIGPSTCGFRQGSSPRSNSSWSSRRAGSVPGFEEQEARRDA